MTRPRIAFLCGSLRKDSFNRRLGQAVMAASADRLDFISPSLDLPLYNQDLDGADPPPQWTEFRDAIRPVDGLLFGSPEYNRSVTGTIKNAIDVGSRPSGNSVWGKKPAAIFSGSPGMIGGFGSNHHLRQSCMTLDMAVMAQPEAYWGLLDDEKLAIDGTINDERLSKTVRRFAIAFADWIDRFRVK